MEPAVELVSNPVGGNADDALCAKLLAPARLAALRKCDEQVTAYEPESFAVVFRWRGRNTRSILVPWLGVSVWSCLCAGVLAPAASAAEDGSGDGGLVANSRAFLQTYVSHNTLAPLSTVVAFLLVFRLGRVCRSALLQQPQALQRMALSLLLTRLGLRIGAGGRPLLGCSCGRGQDGGDVPHRRERG